MKLTIDFETRSECDLKKRGAWVYSEDVSSDWTMLAVKVDSQKTRIMYNPKIVPGLPSEFSYEDLRQLMAEASEIEAHNMAFEYAMWTNCLVPRYGWEPLPKAKLRCSAAKARMCGLPASLEGACAALGLPVQKDKAGHILMLKMCKPRKPTKQDRRKWIEDTESFARMGAYCKTDCDAEHGLSEVLPDLPPFEQRVWLWDLEVNTRGIPVDTVFAARAIEMLADAERRLLAEFRIISGGKVMSPRQVDATLKLLEELECDADNLTSKTVSELLKDESLKPDAKRVLLIRAALAKSSVSKFQTLLNMASRNGDLHQGLIYHGAGTGRWTAKGFQPHNLPRGDFKDTDACVQLILDRDWESVRDWYGMPQAAAATCIRSAIRARPGKVFIAPDLNAIEPRVTAWFADEESVLEIYRNGIDNYRATYARMFNILIKEVTDKQRNDKGKPCVLSLGFGGGVNALRKGAKGTIPEEDLKGLVDKWREIHPKIKASWKEMETCAKQAIAQPGRAFWLKNKKLGFLVSGRFLIIRLPSGRRLYYCDPHIGDNGKGWPEILFRGADPKTKKWVRQNLYGGKIMENVVQAASRDILVENMLKGEEKGYPVILHVHDEAVAEVDENFGSVKEYEGILATPPAWAKDLPLKAEGWRGRRYRK